MRRRPSRPSPTAWRRTRRSRRRSRKPASWHSAGRSTSRTGSARRQRPDAPTPRAPHLYVFEVTVVASPKTGAARCHRGMATAAPEIPAVTRAQAFEPIYRNYVEDVYRYALALLRNPADAEDVTQTTFMNAYRAFLRGEEP